MADMSSPDSTLRDWEDLELVPGERPAEGYRVTLPNFEGPLDLLLHLIKKHEINIFDIPIAPITEKYLAYLRWMEALNLDIAGEFLVMASTLTYIKSRMLLPPDERPAEEEEEELDPRADLVRRLLDYQRYQEVAEELKDQPILDRDVFARKQVLPTTEEDSDPFAEVSVFVLIEAVERIMRHAPQKLSHQILVERISVAERMQELTELLVQCKDITFDDLFPDAPDPALVVVTFIALLEMARLKMVRLHQTDHAGLIYIRGLLEGVDVEQVLASIGPSGQD
jgi:segregation and condensation protein A